MTISRSQQDVDGPVNDESKELSKSARRQILILVIVGASSLSIFYSCERHWIFTLLNHMRKSEVREIYSPELCLRRASTQHLSFLQ